MCVQFQRISIILNNILPDIYVITPVISAPVSLAFSPHTVLKILILNKISSFSVSALSFKTYSNFTLGIKDPMVFNVPSICHNATVVHNVR